MRFAARVLLPSLAAAPAAMGGVVYTTEMRAVEVSAGAFNPALPAGQQEAFQADSRGPDAPFQALWSDSAAVSADRAPALSSAQASQFSRVEPWGVFAMGDASVSAQTAGGAGETAQADATSRVNLAFEVTAPTAYTIDVAMHAWGDGATAEVLLIGMTGFVESFYAESGEKTRSVKGVLAPGSYIFAASAFTIVQLDDGSPEFSRSAGAAFTATFTIPSPGVGAAIAPAALLALRRRRV